MGKRKPMKPMYRTAAEEALILAAIKDREARRTWQLSENDFPHDDLFDKYLSAERKYAAAVRAVVRERKEATK